MLPDNYLPDTDLLKDRVILVTGAGDGIGRVAAITYARHGATVVLLGRTVSKLEAVYDEIVDEGLPEPGIIPMDLGSASLDDFQQIYDVLEENYERLDGLLHNASILGDRVPLEHYDPNQFMKVMHVNFNAVFILTRFLVPLLRKPKDAAIIFSSSGVGRTPRAYWGAYALSKYATEGLNILLADELENTSDIRVNVINPGATRTSMRAAAYPNEDPRTLKTPEDIMPLYLYLMGPDSQSVHGESINAQ